MGQTFLPIPKPGDVLIFKGCVWDAHFEFDAPAVIYSPVGRYSEVGSICAESLYGMVEDVCIDLVTGQKVSDWFSDSQLSEFRWRGWNPRRFSKRKTAVHGQFRVTFKRLRNGDLSFDIEQP